MNQQFRQDAIIELVRQHGYMSIEQLTDHFAVTPQTIRLRKRYLDIHERKRHAKRAAAE